MKTLQDRFREMAQQQESDAETNQPAASKPTRAPRREDDCGCGKRKTAVQSGDGSVS